MGVLHAISNGILSDASDLNQLVTLYRGGLIWDVVEGYGADPTGVTDCADIVNSVIGLAAAAGGGIVFFPPGVYKIGLGSPNKGLVINNSNVLLQGSGKGLTTLRWTGVGSNVMVRFLGASRSSLITNCAIQDMDLDSNSISTTCLSHGWFDHFYVRRVRFLNSLNRFCITPISGQDAIVMQYNLWYQDCDFLNYTNSLLESMMMANTEGFTIENCYWDNFQYAAISLYQVCGNGRLRNLRIQNGINNGAVKAHGVIVKPSNWDIRFDNVHIEAVTGNGFDNGGSDQVDQLGYLRATDMRWRGIKILGAGIGMALPSLDSYSIEDGHIENCNGYGIQIGGTSPYPDAHGSIRAMTIKNNGKGGVNTAGIALQSALGRPNHNADLDICDNHIYDDQATATQLVGLSFSPGTARVLEGVRVSDNHIYCPTPYSQVNGSLGPNVVFIDNPPLNPKGKIVGPAVSSQKATLNSTGYDVLAYISGGTLTDVALGALPAPSLVPVIWDAGAIAGNLTAVSYTLTMTYLNAQGETDVGTSLSAAVTPTAGDQLGVAAFGPPTVAITLTPSSATSLLPAGNYTFAHSFYNQYGESPLGPTTTVTIAASGKVTLTAIGSLPANVQGIRIYCTAFTPSAGGTLFLIDALTPATFPCLFEIISASTASNTIASSVLNNSPLSNATPPAVNTAGTAGLPVPSGTTSVKFYLTTGGTTYAAYQSGVSGVPALKGAQMPPFLIANTSGSATAPTTNGTGTSIGAPSSFPLHAGAAFVPTFTGGPTLTYIGE